MKRKCLIFLFLIILLFTLKQEISAGEYDVEREIDRLKNTYTNFFEINDKQKQKNSLKNILNEAEQLVQTYPDNLHVHEAAAKIFISLGEYHDNPITIYERGKKFADKIKNISPESGRGYFWDAAYMGEIGQEQGIFKNLFNVRPMKEKLEKAIKREPDFAPAYDVLARLYLKAPGWPLSIGNDRKALEYRKKSVELDPGNYEYQWLLYENYLEVNKEKEAAAVLEKILEMPEDKEAKFYYGKDITEEIKEKASKELNRLG